MERKAEAAAIRRLLVAAARSAAQGRAGWRWSPYDGRLHRRY